MKKLNFLLLLLVVLTSNAFAGNFKPRLAIIIYEGGSRDTLGSLSEPIQIGVRDTFIVIYQSDEMETNSCAVDYFSDSLRATNTSSCSYSSIGLVSTTVLNNSELLAKLTPLGLGQLQIQSSPDISFGNSCTFVNFSPNGCGINSPSSIGVFVGGTPRGIQIQIIAGSLPIELASFDAKLEGRDVVLNWSTETETNNHYFEVERMLDGETEWTVVDVIAGAGSTNEVQEYSTVDYNVPRTAYYRLKQVDYDGQYSISDAVAVAIEKNEGSWTVTNVPGRSYQTISASPEVLQFAEEGSVNSFEVRVTNLQGQQVYSRSISVGEFAQSVDLELSHAAAGFYVLQIVDENRSISHTRQISVGSGL